MLEASAANTSLLRLHASEEEYAEFLRTHTASWHSAKTYLLARKHFVEKYPDLEDWFAAPMAARVGRLGERWRRGRMEGCCEEEITCPASYRARPYLSFLAFRGHAWFDWEWFIAVPRLSVYAFFRYVGLHEALAQLEQEAVELGYYHGSARQGLRWAVSRIYMHTLSADVKEIGEEDIGGLEEAIRSFGARPDRDTFFGSEAGYREAIKTYGTHLHLLRVVLYHRGQIAKEPRKKWTKRLERPPLKPRMAAVAERYVAVRRLTARPATIVRIEQALRKFATWLADAHPKVESFAEVDRNVVLEFAGWFAETPVKRTGQPPSILTRRGQLSPLSVFFRDTADWGWEDVPGRPLLAAGDLPKIPERVPRYIPEEELSRMMAAVASLECPYQRAALLIARWSGARRDEIRRLEVNCLDAYPEGTPRLRIPAGKTKQERMVPLTEEAAEAIRLLQAHRAKEPTRGFRDEHTGATTRYLFLHHGKPFSNFYLFDSPLEKACRAAGLVDGNGKPTITAHRFRHTVGKQLAERGARLRTIMSVLGHESANMSMVYAQISDEEVLKDYQAVLGPGAAIAGPLAETLRSGDLPPSDVEWIKSNFFKTELELGHCLRLPQEGPCECDLYLGCPKFVTTPEYAPRLWARREKEFALIEDAISSGWEREVERHRCTLRRIERLLEELGEPVDGARGLA